jgi:hypothetical protein
MAFGRNALIRFRPVAGAAGYRIRVRPANTAAVKDNPFEDVPAKEAEQDGYVRYPVAELEQFPADLEGSRDIHVTALDAAKNESAFLEIDNVPFDFVPPEAPTDGSVVSGDE